MSINKLIMDTLLSLDIDTSYKSYYGIDDKYITFTIDNEEDAEYEDDEAIAVNYYIKLNYWYTKPSDVALYQDIKRTMKRAGFIFDGASDAMDDELYGKTINFIYKHYV